MEIVSSPALRDDRVSQRRRLGPSTGARLARALVPAAMATAAISTRAHAGMVDLKIGEALVGDLCVIDLYASLPETYGQVTSVFGTSIAIGGGFETLVHNDSLGGTWLPQFATNGAIDSFVTIGGLPTPSNYTGIDPLWGADGATQPGIPTGAGWFNSVPPSFQGLQQPVSLTTLDGSDVYVGLATHLARFVFAKDPAGRQLHVSAGISWAVANTPPTLVSVSFDGVVGNIPSPSVVAVFGASLLASCRSRGRSGTPARPRPSA